MSVLRSPPIKSAKDGLVLPISPCTSSLIYAPDSVVTRRVNLWKSWGNTSDVLSLGSWGSTSREYMDLSLVARGLLCKTRMGVFCWIFMVTKDLLIRFMSSKERGLSIQQRAEYSFCFSRSSSFWKRFTWVLLTNCKSLTVTLPLDNSLTIDWHFDKSSAVTSSFFPSKSLISKTKGLPLPSILTSTSSLPLALNLLLEWGMKSFMPSLIKSSTESATFLLPSINQGVWLTVLLYLLYLPPMKSGSCWLGVPFLPEVMTVSNNLWRKT